MLFPVLEYIRNDAYLRLAAPPRWRLEPADATVTTGERVVLDCQADGTPEPRVRWKKSAGLKVSLPQTLSLKLFIYAGEVSV